MIHKFRCTRCKKNFLTTHGAMWRHSSCPLCSFEGHLVNQGIHTPPDYTHTPIGQFVQSIGLTMEAKEVTSNPNFLDPLKGSCHFLCTLTLGSRTLTTYYTQGPAYRVYSLNGATPKQIPPTIEDVLDCLILDSADLFTTFEDWARDFGYSSDSRKAHQTWLTCLEQAQKLRQLLGETLFKQAFELEGL